MPAGYSGTPLAQKLGIKAGHSVVLVNAPANFEIDVAPLPPNVSLSCRGATGQGEGACDVILAFFTSRAALEVRVAALAADLKPKGGLWIAWPKKSSGMATDVTEALVRETGLGTGLVDNKVCAVTDVWSGLRFVHRLKDRR
jgi:hypothetical protein